jgi:hypothetical protein
VTKLTPEECYFDINSEVNDGETRVQMVIFPKDKNHPLVDQLDNDHLTKLPEYLVDVSMHAENLWDWDGPSGLNGEPPRSQEQMREDMIACGYTHQRGLTFF